jgi:hypothetical protein
MAEALIGDVVVSIITRRGGKSSESWVRKGLTPKLWSYFPHEIHLIHRIADEYLTGLHALVLLHGYIVYIYSGRFRGLVVKFVVEKRIELNGRLGDLSPRPIRYCIASVSGLILWF